MLSGVGLAFAVFPIYLNAEVVVWGGRRKLVGLTAISILKRILLASSRGRSVKHILTGS